MRGCGEGSILSLGLWFAYAQGVVKTSPEEWYGRGRNWIPGRVTSMTGYSGNNVVVMRKSDSDQGLTHAVLIQYGTDPLNTPPRGWHLIWHRCKVGALSSGFWSESNDENLYLAFESSALPRCWREARGGWTARWCDRCQPRGWRGL